MPKPDQTIMDPVHRIIAFDDSDTDQMLLKLINAEEFQRLRRIRQLGMTPLVFPGANHNRFAHSIGVMHNARKFLQRMKKLNVFEISVEHEKVVLASALLHDLGHGPFSHAFEKITGDDHEDRTIEMIRDDGTDVNSVLKTFGVNPEHLDRFFNDTDDADGEMPSVLTKIISSQMDADRFDYLIRDSKSTGTSYGQFDQDWLLQNLFVDQEKQRFYLNSKAMLTAEGYVFARYHMYRVVYFHKTTRSAEVMLRLLFKRYKTLVDACGDEQQKKQVVPGTPAHVLNAFSGNKMSLGEYLELDDYAMSEFFKACCKSQDEVLAMMGNGLHHRNLFKSVDCSSVDPLKLVEFADKAKECIKDDGKDPDFFFASDSPSDVPYKPYDPDVDNPATQIYVETLSNGIKELGSQSEAVTTLKKKYQLVRYYFPVEYRDKIGDIAKSVLGGE